MTYRPPSPAAARDPMSSALDDDTTTPYGPPSSGPPPSFGPPPSSGLPPSSGPPPSAGPPATPSFLGDAARRVRDYFLGLDPTFLSAIAPLALVAVILFTRAPSTNYIFDEQEALLANPYVNAKGGIGFLEAIHRDFWGLPPDRSVGSYRPLPNFLWRTIWAVTKQPFFHHFYNVLFHAVNGALLTCVTFWLTRRRGLAYLTGLLFVGCAVLTEAVSGIVGIADVLGGMGAIAALAALALPAWAMPFGVFAAVLLGLFSKESALVCVPLVPFAALIAAPLTHPTRPARFVRALLALLAAGAAFVLYVELRRRWFPAPMPAELAAALPEGAPLVKRALHEALVWFHQAPLPRDPLNNPLGAADMPHRIAGALRVYWRGLTQIVFPWTLSGDYSYPQEPVPDRLVFFGSVAGAAMMVLPPLGSLALWIAALRREHLERRERRSVRAAFLVDGGQATSRRWPLLLAGALLAIAAAALAAYDWHVLRPAGRAPLLRALPLVLWPLPFLPAFLLGLGLLVEGARPLPCPATADRSAWVPLRRGYAGMCIAAIGLTWVVVSYFPHSNIPVVLPTVRAERFWYFPAIGSSLVLAVAFSWLHEALAGSTLTPRARWSWRAWVTPALFVLFFGFQCAQAYRHAMDYRNDLDFWAATKEAVPNSAKAHLNYSVMKGARGDLETRLAESKIAMELAPTWPMAHVYTGDTLCRMHRPDEAFPHYQRGMELGPNELSLIALALQCLHDEQRLAAHDAELRRLAEEHPGTWLAYLATDTLDNGATHGGVDPKYRPRGYNEGPKE
ncbi:tetratricopeptide repeat protein [Sorangium sp. So ce302]|uniref:tetratricopeptide repeat protein n=1 Tax=Sorangium sp. So ce302 TaxID=3133297 RepID=UPI003F642903